MNKYLEKGDEVTFWDTDTATYRDAIVMAVHSWTPLLANVMVQYTTDRGVTIGKFVAQEHVYVRGYNPDARCECGAASVGHTGHAHYCPKATPVL